MIFSEVECPLALADPQYVRITPGETVIEGNAVGHVALDVIPVDTVKGVFGKLTSCDVVHQLVREQHIDVARNDEPSASTSDADVFRDHLKESKLLGVLQPQVEGPRHDDHPCFEVFRVRWPLEHVRDRGSIIRRIPLHDNELDRDAMTFGLGGKTVDEKLRTPI